MDFVGHIVTAAVCAPCGIEAAEWQTSFTLGDERQVSGIARRVPSGRLHGVRVAIRPS
jgi:hypothetical protein